MDELRTQPHELQNWLSELFVGAEVRLGDGGRLDGFLFRIRPPANEPVLLFVETEALEDYSLEEITADLERANVSKLLLSSPGGSLCYRRRVVVPCDLSTR